MIGYHNNYPILIRTRLGIHTFFIKKAIYVYVLFKHDDLGTYRIVDKFKVKPYRIRFWDPKYDHILESKVDLGLQIWDEIKLDEIAV